MTDRPPTGRDRMRAFPSRRVKMLQQPLGYAKPWNFAIEEGEVWICDGWPHRMTESRGRDKAAAGELTPRRINGPPWARGYDRDTGGVWHWIDRCTRFGAEPHEDALLPEETDSR